MMARPKTDIEIQSEVENSRGWIRNFNSKLYDSKLTQLIQDSSNGAEVLKNEIKLSDNRLKLVKSGMPLTKLAP